MIRSTEAVIASVVMLGSIIYLFNVPSTESKDGAEQYIKSVLESYADVGQFLAISDPYNLKLLIGAAIPRGYNQKIDFNYYRQYHSLTGIGYAPSEFYIMLPNEGKLTLPDSELKSNWYRSVFRITNTGVDSVIGDTSISASLFKQDVDDNGILDSVDIESIRVFSNEGELKTTLSTYEDYPDRVVVGLTVSIDISGEESENIYIYYLQGDDYE
ncbi:MAG: hypothetical protein GOU98_03480 [Candidatus Altiarchaeota archaeon]|nr:hypothetical protein [Candidatus Altiarchaeota archaeon]